MTILNQDIVNVELTLSSLLAIQKATGDFTRNESRIMELQATLDAWYDEAQVVRHLDPSIYAS